jgi:predicted dehydrogenase
MAVGIAIIGSGIFVKEEHLPAIQAVPDLLSLKAIYSRSIKSAKNLSGVDLYSDDSDGKTFEDLLKRDDIKGVIIAYVYLQQDHVQSIPKLITIC